MQSKWTEDKRKIGKKECSVVQCSAVNCLVVTISDGRVKGGGKVRRGRVSDGMGREEGEESAHYSAGWLQVKSEY